MSGEDDFLGRWSRRKLKGAEAAPPAAAPEPAPPDERSDEEILAELGLKHPDELQPGDDFRGFMQAAVPDRLRRLALRQLWRSNPTLAALDGLVDYGEDYTDAATVIENLQTVYQVGRGMLRDLAGEDVVEEGRQVARDAPEEPVADRAVDEEPAAVEIVADPAREMPEALPPSADDPAIEAGPTRRRMAFRFDEG